MRSHQHHAIFMDLTRELVSLRKISADLYTLPVRGIEIPEIQRNSDRIR
jgi:hypothetical protein